GGDDRRHDPDGDRRRRRRTECGAGARRYRRPAVRNSNDLTDRAVPVRSAAQGQRRQDSPWRIQRGNRMSDMNRTKPEPAAKSPAAIRPRSLWLLGLGLLLPLAVSVAYGASRHSAHGREVMRTAEQQRDFVPNVRVAKVRAADGEMTVSLPGTTLAFAAANIFARTNGYIETRKVDIGDRVEAGDLLAQITAPE